MLGLTRQFFLKSIEFIDTISALGLISMNKKFSNKVKLCYTVVVGILVTLSAFSLIKLLVSITYKSLTTYLIFSSLVGFLCSAVLTVKLSFQSLAKKRALLVSELVHSAIQKHSISVSKSSALDFCKELLFIKQYLVTALSLVLNGVLIYQTVKSDEARVLFQLASVFRLLLSISLYYSFTMMNLFNLESFLIIKEEILATAHPNNLTLSINKVLPPVEQIESSVFTVSSQTSGWFKDIRSKQIRTIITDFCRLKDIETFNNTWHSAPLTCLMISTALYMPTIPMNHNLFHFNLASNPGSFILLIIFIDFLINVMSMIASNVYYHYTKYQLRKSLSICIYRSKDAQVQRQLMNFKDILSTDVGSNHWKWITIDFSLLITLFDTSVLIFTTFLAEKVL